MNKPARLYPKPEPMNLNPRFLLFGCILFAFNLGAIGLATAPATII